MPAGGIRDNYCNCAFFEFSLEWERGLPRLPRLRAERDVIVPPGLIALSEVDIRRHHHMQNILAAGMGDDWTTSDMLVVLVKDWIRKAITAALLFEERQTCTGGLVVDLAPFTPAGWREDIAQAIRDSVITASMLDRGRNDRSLIGMDFSGLESRAMTHMAAIDPSTRNAFQDAMDRATEDLRRSMAQAVLDGVPVHTAEQDRFAGMRQGIGDTDVQAVHDSLVWPFDEDEGEDDGETQRTETAAQRKRPSTIEKRGKRNIQTDECVRVLRDTERRPARLRRRLLQPDTPKE